MKLYEPLDRPEPIARDLYVVDGPVVRMSFGPLGMAFPTRMVVVRLANGALWVWSPTARSPELAARVDALGPVAHIVSPNRFHYVHIGAWKTAYPNALAWASPGVRERARSKDGAVAFDRDLGDAADGAWAGEIDQLVFRGSPIVEEVVFFHRASRTLLLADLIQNFEPDRLTFSERVLARLGGVEAPDGKTPVDWRLSFLGHRDVARRCLDRVLAWSPERIVIAHGRGFTHDGERELRRAFRWLAPPAAT